MMDSMEMQQHASRIIIERRRDREACFRIIIKLEKFLINTTFSSELPWSSIKFLIVEISPIFDY